MQLDRLLTYFETSPAISLLQARNAPYVIEFLYRRFKHSSQIVVPHTELLAALVLYLEELQEEVEALRGLVTQLQDQYEAAQQEIKDLAREFELEKETLLENARGLEHECDFLLKVVHGVMSPAELHKIRLKAKFDEFNNCWKLPVFVVQNQQTVFPKLSKQQVRDFVHSEMKTVAFPEEEPPREWRPAKGSERVLKTPRRRFQTPMEQHSVSTNGIKRQAISMERKFTRNKNHMRLEPLPGNPGRANFSAVI